ncbi:MAG: leucine-rich repeat protein [Oscillospiraceae bacterium]
MDVTELASELASDGKNPGRVGLLLEDVAYNQSLTFVDIGPQSMTLESVNVEVGESKQIAVSIKPERMADSKLTWNSQDTSVAKVDANGVVTGVADGETMITATAVSGLKAYAKVKVGKGAPVLLTYGEAPQLNDRFQTEDGFCWKVIGPDSVQLLVDQNRASSYAASYANISGDVVIPSTVAYGGKTFRVTSIGYQAFYSNRGITSVVIPEGVTDVGYSAFFMCMSLAKVSLPDTLEHVDTYAFNTFIATEIDKIPANIQWIGESAFQKAKISKLDLPEGLTHIGNKAFMNSLGRVFDPA